MKLSKKKLFLKHRKNNQLWKRIRNIVELDFVFVKHTPPRCPITRNLRLDSGRNKNHQAFFGILYMNCHGGDQNINVFWILKTNIFKKIPLGTDLERKRNVYLTFHDQSQNKTKTKWYIMLVSKVGRQNFSPISDRVIV